MKKQIVTIGLAALSLAACNQDLEENKFEDLTFNVVVESAKTPAVKSYQMETPSGSIITLEALPATKSTQINAKTDFTSVYNKFEVECREGGEQAFHDNAVYNASTSVWDLETETYQWTPGQTLEFVAVASAASDNAAFFSGATFNASPSSTEFAYTLPADPADQKDFLVGYYKGSIASGTVSLKFNHPLTSVQFVTGALPLGATLTVNSITLAGLDAEAQCHVDFSNDGASYTWSNYAGSCNYRQTITDAVETVAGDVIYGGNAAFIVIPRTFPAESDAKIIINITENGREYDIFAPLAGQTWNPGETNIYALSYHGDRKATLVSGPDFNSALNTVSGNKANIEKIVFATSSTVTSGTNVRANAGSRDIFMNWDATTKTITVSSDDYEIFTGSSCESMFSGLTALTSIEGMENVNTKNAENMTLMFYNCSSMTSLPVGHFDTGNVTSMNNMFQLCSSVTSLDLSSFSSESLLAVERMFMQTGSLTQIVFGNNFKCEKVSQFGFMFSQSGLTAVDLSFMQPAATHVDIEYMFDRCSSLQSADLSSFAAIDSEIYFAQGLFSGCRNLARINFGTMTLGGLSTSSARESMMQNTAANLTDGGCTITCTSAAQTVLQSGTGITLSKITWNIVL